MEETVYQAAYGWFTVTVFRRETGTVYWRVQVNEHELFATIEPKRDAKRALDKGREWIRTLVEQTMTDLDKAEPVGPTEAELIRGQLEELRLACARAHELGQRGHAGEAARVIADVFASAGYGEPFTYLPDRPKPEGTKRLFEHGSQQELDRDCARSFVYGVEKLWILPPGSWDAEYVVKTGLGRHTKLTGISRREAAAWLDRAGIDSASHLPEEPATRS